MTRFETGTEGGAGSGDVSLAELSADEVDAALCAFEAVHHVTPATWLDAYRDRSGAVVGSASLYRTAALYALRRHAA